VPLIAYDVNEYTGRVPCILSEDDEAGRLAARHLLELGHRHFAFCGYGGIRWSQERCRAFCELLEGAGGRVEVYRPRSRRPAAWAKEETQVRRWLESLPKPIGVLCANDDQYVCELQNPPLSSVTMASEQAGYEAAALLDRMIRGEERMSRQRITAHATGVTVRQSTSVLMVRKADVRRALRFIRENAGRPIRVADVVKAIGPSHRTLNDQFQSELGCSISRQLTSARIAYISRLLTETKMRIHEIATVVGYEDDRHFSRYFKRATGLTPRAYRRKHAPP
jgi:LacI family transcriptional regulator